VSLAAALDLALPVAAVVVLAASQVLQKRAAQRFATGGSRLAALASPELGVALAALAAGTALWLAALYRVEVSRAVPFLSLGQLLVLAFARAHLREPLAPTHVAGALLIAVGVALVAAS
jgi:uncharacterized membrane protein